MLCHQESIKVTPSCRIGSSQAAALKVGKAINTFLAILIRPDFLKLNLCTASPAAMGTRGYRIIKFRGRYWIFFNHRDSHPYGLGQWLVGRIPADPAQYQKWLQSQRDFFARWDLLLNEILTIQPEDMRKLLSDEPQKAVFYAAFDDRLKANAPPCYGSARSASHDGYIEWTYTIDLDREVFSVGDGAHFNLNKVPGLWIKALFEDRERNKFLLPQLVPAESVATLVLDPPSPISSAHYQSLQTRLVKPRNADQSTNSHLATVGLGVSDFVYRIFGFSEIYSFLISHNRVMAMRPHGRKRCPRKSVYILLFALQLLFSRFVSFRVSFIAIAVFFRPPTPACIYIYSYVSTPGLYRIDMGVFLALWQ